jgi:hypothetical protein
LDILPQSHFVKSTISEESTQVSDLSPGAYDRKLVSRGQYLHETKGKRLKKSERDDELYWDHGNSVPDQDIYPLRYLSVGHAQIVSFVALVLEPLGDGIFRRIGRLS